MDDLADWLSSCLEKTLTFKRDMNVLSGLTPSVTWPIPYDLDTSHNPNTVLSMAYNASLQPIWPRIIKIAEDEEEIGSGMPDTTTLRDIGNMKCSAAYCWCRDSDGNEIPGSRKFSIEDAPVCPDPFEETTTIIPVRPRPGECVVIIVTYKCFPLPFATTNLRKA